MAMMGMRPPRSLLFLPDQSSRLIPIHFRHLHVHQDQIDLPFEPSEFLYAFSPVVRCEDRVPLLFK